MKRINNDSVAVYEICPKCGEILDDGLSLLPSGDKVPFLSCKRCKKIYRIDTEKVIFVPYNPDRKYVLDDGKMIDLND